MSTYNDESERGGRKNKIFVFCRMTCAVLMRFSIFNRVHCSYHYGICFFFQLIEMEIVLFNWITLLNWKLVRCFSFIFSIHSFRNKNLKQFQLIFESKSILFLLKNPLNEFYQFEHTLSPCEKKSERFKTMELYFKELWWLEVGKLSKNVPYEPDRTLFIRPQNIA